MIVVATEDFEVYHEVVGELRERDVEFTTVEPGDPLPGGTRVVVTAGDDVAAGDGVDADVPVVVADAGRARRAVEEALVYLRGGDGRTVVGVDPGTKPGIAVLRGGMVVAAFQVPVEDAADVVMEEVADADGGSDADGDADADAGSDADGVADADASVVRVGDGARLQSARIVDELDDDLRVELVDETGTTPFLGPGARGMGDVLAATNIALTPGEEIEGRTVEPTEGEIEVIKARSREASEENRTITAALARRVAAGDLTLEEALDEHREGDFDEHRDGS